MRNCLLGLLLLTLLQTGCTPGAVSHDESAGPIKAAIEDSGRIRVGFLQSPAPGHAHTPHDIDGQIASAIARTLEQDTEHVVHERTDSLIEGLHRGDLDLAVGLVWPRGIRLPTGINGFAYDTGELVRVCNRNLGPGPTGNASRTILSQELAGFVRIPHPPPALVRVGRLDPSAVTLNALLRAIAAGAGDCALAPSDVAELWSRYAPMQIEVRPLGLAFSRHAVYPAARPELGQRLAALFSSKRVSELSRRTRHRAFGFLDGLPETHYEAFHQEVEQRLPRFEPLFRLAAAQHDLDWILLAAVSYQESHWKPGARSPTGVRGMMMLTRPTAREVGVRDRLDPRQSIGGGARYLRRLLDELPPEVTGDDRLWLSLAAYNMGLRGLAQAQRVAREHGLDPTQWSELGSVLRNARDAKWREAGVYVERIRDFEDIIRFRRHRPLSLQAETTRPEPARS